MSRPDPTTAAFWNQPLEEPWRAVPLLRDARGIEWEAGAQHRNPQRVRARVEAAVGHWIEVARSIPVLQRRGHPPIVRPKLLFDLKGTQIAGMAVTGYKSPRQLEQWVRIHPDLMQRYPVRMIQQTVPHEIAHLVVDWYLPPGAEPHGPEWMMVMVYFGRPPRPFHDMQPAPKSLRGTARTQAALLFEAPHGASVASRRTAP
ncbi:MAG: SprT-like domain-containing protein [Pseudomonadota bacterium]